MEQNNIDFNILARYMTGDCTQEERDYIKEWTTKSDKNREKLKFFKWLWKRSRNDRGIKQVHLIEKEWDRLSKKMQRQNQPEKSGIRRVLDRRIISPLHSTTQQFIRTAAVALIAAIFGFFSYHQFYSEPTPQKPTLREVTTSLGQRVNMTMEDGTNVMLNAESSLELPTKFEEDVREVYLKGEAFFEVAEDKEKPFLVHTKGSVVKVLGTAFAVRSYPEDKDVRVVVSEGKVSLSSSEKESEDEILLVHNQMGQYNLQSKKIRKENVEDMQLYLSWRDGYLKFRNESMAHVAKELERRYDIMVGFENEEIKKKRLTAFLKSRSLTNVLDVIAESVDINYRLENDSVTFHIE